MRPHTPEEVRRWAHQRRPHEREPAPGAGDRLLLREENFGPAVPAVVVAVQEMTTPGSHWNQHGQLAEKLGLGLPDPSVWAWEEARGEFRLHDDPWPWVQVRVITGTEEDGSPVLAPPRWCKEARVRGSAGWMREGSRCHVGDYQEEQ